jgi:hypothetical protein
MSLRFNSPRFSILTVAASVAMLLMLAVAPAADAQTRTKTTASKTIKASSTLTRPSYSYFPSASPTDGRFLSLVGAGLNSMAGDIVEFGIGLPASTDSLRLGFFDGETSGRWDLGTTELEYKLYADSAADGSGTTLLATYRGSSMFDNGWYSVTLPLSAAAKTSDTIYFYRIVVRLTDTTTKTWSNFKVRTNGSAMMLPRAFSFAVPLFTTQDAQTLYPNYPAQTSTTYDGTWTFNMWIPDGVEDMEVWDGDMDFGSYDGVKKDTDDVDTPNAVPAWCMSSVARAEGVATSSDYILTNGVRSTTTRMTGQPADDNYNAWYRRSPSVEYDVVDPNGTTYTNSNPSGNLEWERFRISTILTAASDYDYVATVLPRGNYKIRLRGMDLGNLNAWRVWFNMSGSLDSVALANGGARDTDGPTATNFRMMPLFVGVDSAGNAIEALVPATPSLGGVGNINYWQNQNNTWPVASITIGGITYTREQARAILVGNTNDRSKQVARQLIAAKLNILSGNNSSCIYQVIADAEAWLRTYPINSASPNWTTGRPIHDALESYNNGRSTCATYRRTGLD